MRFHDSEVDSAPDQQNSLVKLMASLPVEEEDVSAAPYVITLNYSLSRAAPLHYSLASLSRAEL